VRFLVTAGPTREPIDPVRYLSNRSSGKMGYAIAKAAIEARHQLILISGNILHSSLVTIKTLLATDTVRFF